MDNTPAKFSIKDYGKVGYSDRVAYRLSVIGKRVLILGEIPGRDGELIDIQEWCYQTPGQRRKAQDALRWTIQREGFTNRIVWPKPSSGLFYTGAELLADDCALAS